MPTGPLTFLAQAADQKSNLVKGSLEMISAEYELSDILTVGNTGGALTQEFARPNPDIQPAANKRNVNSTGQFVYGAMETVKENVSIYHDAFSVDTAIQGDSTHLWQPAEVQMKFITEQMARAFVYDMVNGNPDVSDGVDGGGIATFPPAGLRFRAQNTGRYGLDPGVFTQGITGASIDLSGTITSTIANNLLDSIDELQNLTAANVVLMNFRMKTLFARSARLGGLLKTTEDQIGRRFDELFGMRVIVPKLKAVSRTERNMSDTSAWVLPYENSSGVISATATPTNRYASLFFARVGAGHLEGITNQGMIVEGPVKALPPARSFLYQMEYGLGYKVGWYRDIAQLYGIKIG